MKLPLDFSAGYAPWFLRWSANKRIPTEVEMKGVVKKAHVTSLIMPDLYDLFIRSQVQLDFDIRRLTWGGASRAAIKEKQHLLRTIREEARRGDKVKRRLARTVDVSSDRTLAAAIRKEITKPSDSHSPVWRTNISRLVADYHCAAVDLVTAAYVGVSQKEVLAGKALYLFQQLTIP
jgi:hypothetical protein